MPDWNAQAERYCERDRVTLLRQQSDILPRTAGHEGGHLLRTDCVSQRECLLRMNGGLVSLAQMMREAGFRPSHQRRFDSILVRLKGK